LQILKRTADELIKALSKTMERINPEQVNKLINILLEAKDRNTKIIVVGAGRSGLVGRAFAMRLMHLGFIVHVIGETITPAVEEDDILFAISGSGTTTIVVSAARIAKKMGGRVVSLTSYKHSPVGRCSDHIVVIRGRTKLAEKRDYFSRQILGVHEPLAPLGTVFEVASFIFLDGLVVELMQRLGKTEEEMKKRHATIE